MISLRGNKLAFNVAAVSRDGVTVRLSTDTNRPMALRASEGFVATTDAPPAGFGWYVFKSAAGHPETTTPSVRLAPEFDYLGDGDVVHLSPAQGALRVLHRRSVPYNSFLLTERCNNYCLMCSQPPRNVQDGWIAEEILEALPLIDRSAGEICFTGGEPTLLGDRFLELVRAAKSYLPDTALHILSNGRSFANESLARDLGAISHPDLMLGIPLYGDLAHIHDHVVQADGAYDETIRGILNLKRHGVRVEVRVVLQQQTIPRLPQLAEFLARNLLFVDHVALMGLEMTGFARANLDQLWIDPADYQPQLVKAVGTLDRANIKTSIYNSQLCVLDRSLWRFAKRSISDWKQEYMPECVGCTERVSCGGFFSSAHIRYSDHIQPIIESEMSIGR